MIYAHQEENGLKGKEHLAHILNCSASVQIQRYCCQKEIAVIQFPTAQSVLEG